jgi:nitric oxide reductase large subunit
MFCDLRYLLFLFLSILIAIYARISKERNKNKTTIASSSSSKIRTILFKIGNLIVLFILINAITLVWVGLWDVAEMACISYTPTNKYYSQQIGKSIFLVVIGMIIIGILGGESLIEGLI